MKEKDKIKALGSVLVKTYGHDAMLNAIGQANTMQMSKDAVERVKSAWHADDTTSTFFAGLRGDKSIEDVDPVKPAII
uniref:Uncharacterized protein n=1 Tax=Hyaloperonospora arabidopsidis (strain Emoy2) TaxID=559515 RepID=M4BDC3_HYAAE